MWRRLRSRGRSNSNSSQRANREGKVYFLLQKFIIFVNMRIFHANFVLVIGTFLSISNDSQKCKL